MIPKDIFPVYGQYNEDIVIQALLASVRKGFYVDVGANHETYHSVTKYFYDKGWSGINIEPIPRLIAEFRKARTRDINLQLAVSVKEGTMELRDYPEHDGLSTLSPDSKIDPKKAALPHNDYLVKVDSLKNIFNREKVKEIDFLKIDVEGYEFEVLKSNDWTKYRPRVICIEANHQTQDWLDYLNGESYIRVIFDGLNEYYVAKESLDSFDLFAERSTLLAHNAIRNHNLNMWKSDIKKYEKRINFLEDLTDKQDGLIRSTQILSLKDKPFIERIKVAAKGLTIDYLRFRSIK